MEIMLPFDATYLFLCSVVCRTSYVSADTSTDAEMSWGWAFAGLKSGPNIRKRDESYCTLGSD